MFLDKWQKQAFVVYCPNSINIPAINLHHLKYSVANTSLLDCWSMANRHLLAILFKCEAVIWADCQKYQVNKAYPKDTLRSGMLLAGWSKADVAESVL